MAAVGAHRLGIHAGNKQRVVADVLAQRALGIERRRGAVHRVGGQHHLVELFDRTAHLVAHLVELV
jgi:hypothetical protein